jgi:MoaA/NifB/PqqE/SkfB family radical SAM enzyme
MSEISPEFENQDDVQPLPEHEEARKAWPNIPETFPEGFPPGYRPWVDGWAFSLEKMKEKNADGTYKLLTLDLSISEEEYIERVNSGPAESLSERAEKEYKCDIRCKHCFECKTDTNNPLMTFDEVKGVVERAKALGLETVKFLGPGELLHNPKLFEILDYFEQEGIIISIFTKGVILGDDTLAEKNFHLSASELCNKIASYSTARLLVGFTSASPDVEQARIGSTIQDFSEKRNRGLENATEAGMNSNPQLQRMALICAPVLRDNIDEVLAIYQWGAKRNIPTVVAPTMVSGKGQEQPEVTDTDFKERRLVDLYASIYEWMVREGIMTLDDVKQESVSPYAGYACNQFINGMFIRKDGRVQACPGNESYVFRYSNDIRKENLAEVWKHSVGYKKREQLVESGKITLTQPCYAKTEGELMLGNKPGSIPKDFYESVLRRLEVRLGAPQPEANEPFEV